MTRVDWQDMAEQVGCRDGCELLAELVEARVTVREIERMTGVSKSVVHRELQRLGLEKPKRRSQEQGKLF